MIETGSEFFLFICFVITIALSGLFSGTEVALLALSDIEKDGLKESDSKRSRRIEKLLTTPQALFVSLRLAVIFSNIVFVSSALLLTETIGQFLGLPIWAAFFIVVALLVSILFCVNALWANLFVLSRNRSFAEAVSLPITLYFQAVKPFAGVVARVLMSFSTKYELLNKSRLLSHHKIISLVDEGEEVVSLQDSEREMIHSIFAFGETEVHEIMVPRTDMVCVAENTSLEEVTKTINEQGHTRLPVYRDDVDHILGIFHAKDLLTYVANKGMETIDLKSLARPAYFVPESKKLHLLLKEFQKEKYHMAIVVDEYGGTAGLVTLEDVIEEIVGDIQDEYDDELPLYRKLDDNTYMVDAKIDLHELNDKLGIDLPTEGEYESLGGFILSLTGYVPEENEVVAFSNHAFIVDRIDRNRIVQVKLTTKESPLQVDDNSNATDG